MNRTTDTAGGRQRSIEVFARDEKAARERWSRKGWSVARRKLNSPRKRGVSPTVTLQLTRNTP